MEGVQAAQSGPIKFNQAQNFTGFASVSLAAVTSVTPESASSPATSASTSQTALNNTSADGVDTADFISSKPQGLSADIVSTLLDSPKSLVITAQQIVDAINKQLSVKLPQGVESLKPEEVTPEATATSIVTGVTSLFDSYRKSNPDLSDEEALTKFVAAAKQGIEKGYGEASETLKGLGAFDIEGIEDGVRQTKLLIDDKLAAFEKQKRVDLGIDTPEGQIADSAATTTSNAIKASAAKTLSITA